jgi:peptidoglycan/xylan/chitin deacetylase (PgdA/CDA1 family)
MADLRYAIYRAGLEALYFSGARFVLGPAHRGVGAIFTLHHVRPARRGAFQPNRMLEVEARFLERTIEHLRRRQIDIVSMDEVRRRLAEGDFARYFVALTFDDGYRDNLEFAWPVLKRHGVPFTLYIATSFPDRLGELWWVALERLIARTDRVMVEMDGKARAFDTGLASEKRNAFGKVYWWLRGLEDETELRKAMRDLAGRYGVDMTAPCRELCMDWSEIAKLAADPLCTIGAHTINHVFLSKVSEDVARAEMQRSAEVIEAALGTRPEHFAYPYGDASAAGAREFSLAAKLGFATAVTTQPGVLVPEHRRRLTSLPRISLNGHFQALRYVDVLLSGLPFALRRLAEAA